MREGKCAGGLLLTAQQSRVPPALAPGSQAAPKPWTLPAIALCSRQTKARSSAGARTAARILIAVAACACTSELSDVRLNLASNWARLFPRESAPQAELVAVRSGHVMYIEAAAGNGQWLIRDYNSGGGLSRMHVRDVRGYAFVNPRATVAAR